MTAANENAFLFATYSHKHSRNGRQRKSEKKVNEKQKQFVCILIIWKTCLLSVFVCLELLFYIRHSFNGVTCINAHTTTNILVFIWIFGFERMQNRPLYSIHFTLREMGKKIYRKPHTYTHVSMMHNTCTFDDMK